MGKEISLACDNCGTSFETAYDPKVYARVSIMPDGERTKEHCPICAEYLCVNKSYPPHYPSWFIREENISRIYLLRQKLLNPQQINMSYGELMKSLVPDKWLSFFRRRQK